MGWVLGREKLMSKRDLEAELKKVTAERDEARKQLMVREVAKRATDAGFRADQIASGHAWQLIEQGRLKWGASGPEIIDEFGLEHPIADELPRHFRELRREQPILFDRNAASSGKQAGAGSAKAKFTDEGLAQRFLERMDGGNKEPRSTPKPAPKADEPSGAQFSERQLAERLISRALK